jgi:hypothetical protein
MAVTQEIIDAIDTLWKIPAPGPDNIHSDPAFTTLIRLYSEQYRLPANPFGLSMSLSYALRSLGAPCLQSSTAPGGRPTMRGIAHRLDDAFTRKSFKRTYICPLDYADDLPALIFGNAQVRRFSATELEELFDEQRLMRHFQGWRLDSLRFSEFFWLVIEEDVQVEKDLAVRLSPFSHHWFDRDLGAIDPHQSRFPLPVEDALFFLMLGPWESWAALNEVDWRGFKIRWVYTLDEDLFTAPSKPPSADSLSWEPHIYDSGWGEVVEDERRIVYELSGNAHSQLQTLDRNYWEKLVSARSTPLFETPVEHFFVRAFLSDGIDEFMAHLTVIEAAFGQQSDHDRKGRSKDDPMRGAGATKRVAARLAAALNEAEVIEAYEELFSLRSAFIHGRSGVDKISTETRVLARTLARKAATALISLAGSPDISRESVLSDLLVSGAVL